MSMVGKKAPDFKASAIVGGNRAVSGFTLSQFEGKKDVLLFFYPKDFTFVCPTEVIAFQDSLHEFDQRGVAVVGVSTDTEETHLAWLQTPHEKGGIKGVTYPLVADADKTISDAYGVLGGEFDYNDEGRLVFKGLPIAYRGSFLIDKTGTVRHAGVNDLPLGRNIQEYLRLIDAMHHVDEHGEVCPADWSKGARAMKATNEGVSDYLSSK